MPKKSIFGLAKNEDNIKKGNFVRIISVTKKRERRSSLQRGSVYKIFRVQKCHLFNIIGCKTCKTNFLDIEVCTPLQYEGKWTEGIPICGCKIRLYKGKEENTMCYKYCEDYLFCELKWVI